MYVRARDKANQRYYKSLVYGLFNTGYYEQAILFNPHTDCFELVDCVDKEQKHPEPLYECINKEKNDWIIHEYIGVSDLNSHFKDHDFNQKIEKFAGYKDVFEDFQFIQKIFRDKKVPLAETGQTVKENEDIDEWRYIRTQKDADEFMELFMGFHDSTINKVIYEGDYGKEQLNVIVDNSGWYGIVELCFEGFIRMHLQGVPENGSWEMYDATLIVKDESIYWADTLVKEEDMEYKGNWIKALNLKWKKIK